MFCKDCADWDKYDRLGECGSVKWKYGYGYKEDDINNNEIWVEEDEGWGCYTGPLFGCIHFRKP